MIIVIERKDGVLQCVESDKPRGTIQWLADGMSIYVVGAMSIKTYPVIANIAMNEVLRRGRSLKSMRRHISGGGR